MKYYKICVMGESDMGKKSLIRSVAHRQFSDRYLHTLGVKISRISLQVPMLEAQENRTIQLMIWELANQAKFQAIAPSYFQGANAALVVADLTSSPSLYGIAEQIEQFLAVNPESAILIALNNCNLSLLEQNQWLQNLQFPHLYPVLGTYIFSAKTGENVDKIFADLAKYLRRIV